MSYTVYRVDTDGSEQVVACTDDLCEVGQIIDEDRGKIDWDADYRVVPEGRGK